VHFEAVKRYENDIIRMPERKTKYSAGYDFYAAENIVIPPYHQLWDDMLKVGMDNGFDGTCIDMDTMKQVTKAAQAKITLVPTGVKCILDNDKYLELSMRSSGSLKHWLILGNGVGIIDADYANNPDNDGEIFFQIINLSPFSIRINKGDPIGQGIIKTYCTTSDDCAQGERKGGFGSTDKEN
jgi:dUTP pyrophosphatase